MITKETKFKETEIGPIPEEWDVIKISKISKKITKGTTPTTIEGFSTFGVRFLKAENLSDNGQILNDKLTYINQNVNELLKRSILEENDVLYTIAGTIGRVALVKKCDLPANTNQAIAIIRPDLSRINLDYLKYYLISQKVKDFLVSKTVQGVQANLSLTELGNAMLVYPKINEQKQIAEILSSLDDKIELNRQINANLEKLASSLFKHWFVDFEFPNENGKPYKSSGGKMIDSVLGEIPEGWKVSIIGKEFETFLGGTPSRVKNEYWTNGTVPWINSGMVNEYRITEASEYITEEAVKNSATKLLPKGTVVIAITGATLGQYSLLEIDSSFNQSVIGIKENKNLKKEFIYYWIAITINTLINAQTGGAQQHINKQVVDSHKILIPKQNALNKYYEIVGPIFEFISSNCFEIKNLSALRNSLLPQLMSGKIRVK